MYPPKSQRHPIISSSSFILNKPQKYTQNNKKELLFYGLCDSLANLIYLRLTERDMRLLLLLCDTSDLQNPTYMISFAVYRSELQ